MKKVLVIEDDPEIVHLLEIHLKDLGCEVLSAGQGDHGLRMAVNENPDLIILDVMLPEMDGIEVCQKIRAQQIKSPIMMITAKSEEIDKVLGLEVGADDYLTKPFNTEELLVRMNNLIELRRKLREKYSREFQNITTQKIPKDLPKVENDFIRKVSLLIEENLDNEELSVEDFAKKLFIDIKDEFG